MAYNTLYYFEFDDTVYPTSAHWRVQIDKDGYVGGAKLLPYMDDNPLTIARTSESESKISPFVGSKATIRYVYDGTTNTPHPREFKDIQENTLLVSIFKNGVLNFRGFVKPDGGQYPLFRAPFSYEINCTDYINGMKNRAIDIGIGTEIFYGFISFTEFIRKTLFNAASYPEVAVKWLNCIIPDVTGAPGSGLLCNKIYYHTDIFYDFDDGADSVYDALEKWLLSMRSRLLFSNGTYWIQRVADTHSGANYIELITPSATTIVSTGYNELFYDIPSIPTAATKYVEDSGTVRITPAIYSQTSTYKLKAINKLVNFLWQDVITDFSSPNFGRPVDWTVTEAVAVGSVSRGGTGTLSDPYNLVVSGRTNGYDITGYLRQEIQGIKSGQFVQFDMKVGVYYSLGQRVYIEINGVNPTTGDTAAYTLDSSGSWVSTSAPEILITGDKKTRTGTTSITSKVVPGVGFVYSLFIGFRFVQAADDPEDPLPAGEVVRNVLYSPFIRVFNNLVASIQTTTVNSKNYTNIPPEEDPLFLDTIDSNLSNTVYYNTGSAMAPIPNNNWRDTTQNVVKTLDAWSGHTILDEFNVPSNVVEVDIISNTLEFHHTLIIQDVDLGIRSVQLSDTYDVKDGIHKLVTEQVFQKGTGTGSYTLKSITK